MKRIVRKVAVLGSGIMGSRIACHLANTGHQVLLLDMPYLHGDESTKDSVIPLKNIKNKIADDSLVSTLKSKPSPIYAGKLISRITTGNFEDNLEDLSEYDWIIEAIIENEEIKKGLFRKIEEHRKPGSLLTTNTSGIPISALSQEMPEEMSRNFCGTHFFNPPRYLPLLEIIPGAGTDKKVLEFLIQFGDKTLGKKAIICKDTPAFIANRVGVFSIMSLFHIMPEFDFTVEEIDFLTGVLIGRPKSATFRTCDVVGLDTIAKVAKGVYDHCPNDEKRTMFILPDFIEKMVNNGIYGEKSGKGFYQKSRTGSGEKVILSLDVDSLQYKERRKIKYPSVEEAKKFDSVTDCIRFLMQAEDQVGEFFRKSMYTLFAYVSHRVPEISDSLNNIDDAMRAGFGWSMGPFQLWDVLGVKETCNSMQKGGFKYALWVDQMLSDNVLTFYNNNEGKLSYYDALERNQKTSPFADEIIILKNLADKAAIWKNKGATLYDLGDGVVNLEFHTKMNTVGSEIIEGINIAIETAENNFTGLVIGNQGEHFSAGANLGLIYMFALEQEFEEIDIAVRVFQNINLKIRYSKVPVVVAPHGLTLGGGCEICLHGSAVQAFAETYTGLVEFGVGLIPAGGGTKEFARRAAAQFTDGGIELNVLKNWFLNIATAKVSTSALEAYDLGILRQGIDHISINKDRHIADSKLRVIDLASNGYTPPDPQEKIKVLGKQALGMIYSGASNMRAGSYISDHDLLISKKLGYVISGGDISSPSLVPEQYLLDLEREAFLSLCGTTQTLERIKSVLTSGKILRN